MLKLDLQAFAVPFRKKRMRRTHLKKEVSAMTKCKECGANLKPHRACPTCGKYKGEEKLNIKSEEE